MEFHIYYRGSLQAWTKVIAILQIILAAISLYVGVSVLFSGGRMALAQVTFPLNGTTPSDTLPPTTDSLDHFNSVQHQAVRDLEQNLTKLSNRVGAILIEVGIYMILVRVVTLVLSVILFHGVANRIADMCRPWLIAQAIFLLLATVLFFVGLTFSTSDECTNYAGAAGLINNAYCMWVVYAFINELREEEEAKRLGKENHEKRL